MLTSNFPPHRREFGLLAALVIALLAAFAASAADAPASLSPAERLFSSPRPIVIGHRGYAAFAPENSLASFDRALAAGVDLVELDDHHSADGIPMVLHDGTLDRTTDAVARWGGKDLALGRRTSAELGQLEIGAWFNPPFPGQKLPTLRAALAFIQPRGVTLVERKSGDPATLSRLLKEGGYVNQLVVQSFDWEFLRGFHALQPDQVLGALGPVSQRAGRKVTDEEKELNGAWLADVKSTGARVAVWNRQVSRAAVAEAHALGLRVWVYTINELPVAQSLLALGVDGLISDNPAILWKAIASR